MSQATTVDKEQLLDTVDKIINAPVKAMSGVREVNPGIQLDSVTQAAQMATAAIRSRGDVDMTELAKRRFAITTAIAQCEDQWNALKFMQANL